MAPLASRQPVLETVIRFQTARRAAADSTQLAQEFADHRQVS